MSAAQKRAPQRSKGGARGGSPKPLPRRSPSLALRALSRALVDLADDTDERSSDRAALKLAAAVRAMVRLVDAQQTADCGELQLLVPGATDQGGTAGLRWLPAAAPASAQPKPPLARAHREVAALAALTAEHVDAAADRLAAARLLVDGDGLRGELDELGRRLHFAADALGQTASVLTGVDDGTRRALGALRLLAHLAAPQRDREAEERDALDAARRSFTAG